MPDIKTPSYIKALTQPRPKAESGRKVWSIDLQYVWLPFFTATNTQGDTAIPHEAIGAPLRLAKDTDGSIRFNKTGRPVLKVAGELSEHIRMVRENFVAGLVGYAGQVMKAKPDEYKAEAEACHQAGEPIIQKANADLSDAQAV
ncbi:MAG: hypothetical protein PHQ43_10635, partial [Dehalococcoidales bacterium]|nr:hypothetical protein [Dehalococcoidales bacterium]